MVSCAACGLAKTTKTKDQGISFHQFPKGQRGESWAEFVKRNKFEANWAQKATSCLCSRHFNENCFDRTSQLLIRLHPTAIPTIIVDRVRYKRCEEEQLLGPTHQQNLMSTPELEPGPSTSTGIEILRNTGASQIINPIMSKNMFCCLCKKSKRNQRSGDSTFFFSFPKTQQFRDKWLTVLNIKAKTITENYAVCSAHFLNSDIKIVDGVPTLKRTAIPLNKVITDSTMDKVPTEASTSGKERVKHKMVPVYKSDATCQLDISESAVKSESDSSDENVIVCRRETRSSKILEPAERTGRPRKRSRTSHSDDKEDSSESLSSSEEQLEDIEKSKIMSLESNKSSTMPKGPITSYEAHSFAVVNHALKQFQKREKNVESKYQKALMKLHELTKSLDTIGDKFSIENFSRKVLRAPGKSKLAQFFNQSSENISMEQINIEIVDDDFNIGNDDLSPNDVKAGERKVYLKRKLVELTRAQKAKQEKINELKMILKLKTDIIHELEAEVGRLKNIEIPESEQE